MISDIKECLLLLILLISRLKERNGLDNSHRLMFTYFHILDLEKHFGLCEERPSIFSG